MNKPINEMTREELSDAAFEKGYTTYQTPRGDVRIGGSKVKQGADTWMNQVNNRLKELDDSEAS